MRAKPWPRSWCSGSRQFAAFRLTVAVGRDRRVRKSIENIRRLAPQPFELVGWSEELPRLLRSSHLLISKAGGATVQEAIAAGCPMIVNHVIPGQEEGNARFLVETNSGAIAIGHDDIVAAVRSTFANDAARWREWSANIAQLSRPAASLDTARLLSSSLVAKLRRSGKHVAIASRMERLQRLPTPARAQRSRHPSPLRAFPFPSIRARAPG